MNTTIVSRRLFGREEEIRRLEAALDRAEQRTVVRMVAGVSGVGKSSLVDELRRFVARRGGLFASGVCDPHGRPYGAVLTALRELARRKLAEDGEATEAWARRLADSLGENLLGVLIEALPELLDVVENVVEKAPENRAAAGVAVSESVTARFLLCARRFLATFNRPVVLFFDDLQWIDAAGVELFRSLAKSSDGSLLLIGAYRDDEVGEDHPVADLMSRLRNEYVDVEIMRLLPLSEEVLGEMIAQRLDLPPAEAQPLTSLLYRKTAGNPLFADTFLQFLDRRGLLDRSASGGWDLETIGALKSTEQIVQIVSDRLQELPETSRHTIAAAAALGKEVDLAVLDAVCGKDSETGAVLADACRDGLFNHLDGRYVFAHDRVREGAYALLDEGERGEIHTRIGRALQAADGDVYEIVDHLHRGIGTSADPARLRELVELNAEAGRRAKASGAFPAAWRYFRRAVEMLSRTGVDPWEKHYEEARLLYADAAEAASVAGELELAEQLCETLSLHARSLLHAAPAYETRVYVLTARWREEAAMLLALEGLGRFGINISPNPSAEDLEAAVLAADRAVRKVLAEAEAQDAGELPKMQDPEALAASRLLLRTTLIAPWARVRFARSVMCRMVEHTASHGIGPASAFAYALMTDIYCSERGDLKTGRRVGKLALALADLPGADLPGGEAYAPGARTVVELVLGNRTVHPNVLRERYARHMRENLEVGNHPLASASGMQASFAALLAGHELTEVEALAEKYRLAAQGLEQPMLARAIEGTIRLMGVLLGRYPLDEAIDTAHPANVATGIRVRLIATEMLVRLVMRDPERALAVAQESMALRQGLLPIFPFDFLRCMIFLDASISSEALEECRARLEEQARAVPELFGHRLDLVTAHERRAAGQAEEALRLYAKAIEGARRYAFPHEEALAHELAGELCLESGRERDAVSHLENALAIYRRWGASAKVLQLRAKYPDLLPSEDAWAASALENARLRRSLEQALAEVAALKDRLQIENLYLREEIRSRFEEIIGESEAMKKVLYKVEQVASTDATVLILGETGTGKELIARALHRLSPRRERPLVKVNCAALPANLIESELFGHEKGAFTGALKRRMGRFELADSGTLFLDEIGDLPLDLQAKLLRALQEGEFERLGSTETLRVDVRIIAATHRDLHKAMAEGTFRSDLYYRLTVFPVELPPLRERQGDIPPLVQFFIDKKRAKLGRRVETISRETLDRLVAYPWPGNVRELENIVERALILSPGEVLELEDSFGGTAGAPRDGAVAGGPERLVEVERAHILKVLEACGWKVKGRGNAAERLGMAPPTLRDRMKKLEITRPR